MSRPCADLLDDPKLLVPPATFPAPGFAAPGVRPLFYAGPGWRGRPTRIFSWYGVPAGPGPFPAMILVHGGGGTAHAEWVRLWTERGYAALAMDTCGCVPGGSFLGRPRHEHGGPPGWGGFDQIEVDPVDQWMHHAAAAVRLAVSLVGSFPEVDATRIGLTGISWGGVISLVAAGHDARLAVVAPVYGCGDLGQAAFVAAQLAPHGPARAARWLELWDPLAHVAGITAPLLWVTGTNDTAFPLDCLQRTSRRITTDQTFSVRHGMAHGHDGPGEYPPEIRLMADHLCRGGPPLPRFLGQGHQGHHAWADFHATTVPGAGELLATCDKGPWLARAWQRQLARVDLATGRLHATLPAGCTAYFFNVVTANEAVVSSALVDVDVGHHGRAACAT